MPAQIILAHVCHLLVLVVMYGYCTLLQSFQVVDEEEVTEVMTKVSSVFGRKQAVIAW